MTKLKYYDDDVLTCVGGTIFQVFGALDDTYTYFFIANLKQNIVIRMQPKNAAAFLSGMKKVN